jgi:hypothetical protein
MRYETWRYHDDDDDETTRDENTKLDLHSSHFFESFFRVTFSSHFFESFLVFCLMSRRRRRIYR